MVELEPPIIVEESFEASAETVWKALTELNQMKQWFFENINSFEPVVGFETSFVVQVNNRSFTHHWRITESIPNKKIAYRWNYLEYPGDSILSIELAEIDDIVHFKLTHQVTDPFQTTSLNLREKVEFKDGSILLKAV